MNWEISPTQAESFLKTRVKKKNDDQAKPIRKAWDFESCKSGLEQECFQYEYARQTLWIQAEFILNVKIGRRVFIPDNNFGRGGIDRNGFWHHVAFGNSEKDDWGLILVLRSGFPDKPFLDLDHSTQPEEELPRESGLWPSDDVCSWASNLKNPDPMFGAGHILFVDWQRHDNQLLEAFKRWLTKTRPHPPAKAKRGRGKSTEKMADLKALGALRLLEQFTAQQALDFTAKETGKPLFAKIPDWYEARARAQQILEDEFRWENTSSVEYLHKFHPQSKYGYSLKSVWI